jgi:hypothetical protein
MFESTRRCRHDVKSVLSPQLEAVQAATPVAALESIENTGSLKETANAPSPGDLRVREAGLNTVCFSLQGIPSSQDTACLTSPTGSGNPRLDETGGCGLMQGVQQPCRLQCQKVELFDES